MKGYVKWKFGFLRPDTHEPGKQLGHGMSKKKSKQNKRKNKYAV